MHEKMSTREIENYLSADQIKSKIFYVQKCMATEFFTNFYRKKQMACQFVKVSQVQKNNNNKKIKRSFEFCISDKRMKKD